MKGRSNEVATEKRYTNAFSCHLQCLYHCTTKCSQLTKDFTNVTLHQTLDCKRQKVEEDEEEEWMRRKEV